MVDKAWKEDHFSYSGKYYSVQDLVLQPKPVSKPRPVIYAGGESETAKELIAQKCDAYVMHGDSPERVAVKIQDLSERRERKGLPRMIFGVAGYSVVRETEREAQQELARITDVKQSAAGYQNYQDWLANTQSLSSAFRWKTTPSRIAACARAWWGLHNRSRIALGSLRTRAWICCYFSSVRSWKRWKGSRIP